jgi:membrane fusion protein (multidrug efflux system)
MQGDAWVVTGGLKEGERVVLDGVQKVQPGMTVQAVNAPNQAAPTLANADAGAAPVVASNGK